MKLAPVALFVYNRVWHTKQTVEALQKNKQASDTDLIIYADGIKDINNKEQVEQVKGVRDYIKNIAGFKSLKLVEREENWGLARSITTGVSEVLTHYERVIVMEDDLVSSRYFLQFMNEALELYENDEEVVSIHGYIYPVKGKLPETFFIKGADCWGWATWRRGWELYEDDGQKLLDQFDKREKHDFNFYNSYPYIQMLIDQINRGNDSWAIRWYAAAFLKGKLTLYPGRSLLKNVGFDQNGTHCDSSNKNRYDTDVEGVKVELKRLELKEDKKTKRKIALFFRSLDDSRGAIDFLKNKIKSLIKRVVVRYNG